MAVSREILGVEHRNFTLYVLGTSVGFLALPPCHATSVQNVCCSKWLWNAQKLFWTRRRGDSWGILGVHNNPLLFRNISTKFILVLQHWLGNKGNILNIIPSDQHSPFGHRYYIFSLLEKLTPADTFSVQPKIRQWCIYIYILCIVDFWPIWKFYFEK